MSVMAANPTEHPTARGTTPYNAAIPQHDIKAVLTSAQADCTARCLNKCDRSSISSQDPPTPTRCPSKFIDRTNESNASRTTRPVEFDPATRRRFNGTLAMRNATGVLACMSSHANCRNRCILRGKVATNDPVRALQIIWNRIALFCDGPLAAVETPL